MATDIRSQFERRLRLAVADLANRSVTDIEAVWRALTEDERTRLAPLLADAASARADAPLDFVATLRAQTPSSRDDGSGDEGMPAMLARLVGHWPDTLLIQALRQFGDEHRRAFLSLLPEDRRATLSRHPSSPTITTHAHDALIRAARCAAASLPPPEPAGGDPVAPIRPTWRQRFSRSLRTGRSR